MKPYSGFGKFQGPSETCRWNTVLDFEKRCHVPVRKWFDDDLNTGCTGMIFSKVKLSLKISTTFEFPAKN